MNAISGQSIPEINFNETGIVTLTGDSANGDYASAGVGMAFFYQIRGINGTSVNGPQGSANMTFTPSGGVFNLSNGELNNQQWSGSLNINFDSILAANSLTGHVTSVEITFDNTLTAAEYNAGFASITKQFLQISVPEPSSALFLLCGGGLLASYGLQRHFRRRL